jgi:hypothetical protein
MSRGTEARDLDPCQNVTDPDPYQNVTDPLHCRKGPQPMSVVEFVHLYQISFVAGDPSVPDDVPRDRSADPDPYLNITDPQHC